MQSSAGRRKRVSTGCVRGPRAPVGRLGGASLRRPSGLAGLAVVPSRAAEQGRSIETGTGGGARSGRGADGRTGILAEREIYPALTAALRLGAIHTAGTFLKLEH